MIELHLNDIKDVLGAQLIGSPVAFIGCSTDTRRLHPGSMFVALRGENFDGHDFVMTAQEQGAVALLIEKPVDCHLPKLLVHDTRKALKTLASFWRQQFDLPVIAITGSNGKTTTKEMVRSILAQQGEVLANQGNYNNEIGVPLTLFQLGKQHHYAVIEMGANHAGEIATLTHLAQPNVAVITQCAPAHLDGFKDIVGVAKAKGEIFTGLQNGGTAVINFDDAYAQLWLSQLEIINARIFLNISSFGIENQAEVMAKDIRLNADSSDFILHTRSGQIEIHLPFLGRHNIMNALAATACTLACGCSLTSIREGLQNVQAVKGRLQRCQGIKGTILIDDTYNANPASLHAALKIFKNFSPPYCLVLGDMNELGSQSDVFHQQAGQLAREAGVKHLWAIGSMTRYSVESFGQGAQHFVNHEELINALSQELPQGATVLVKGSRGMQMEQVIHALRV